MQGYRRLVVAGIANLVISHGIVNVRKITL